MSTEEMSIQELEAQFSEQEALRREKLVELQIEGKDPFDVYKVERTHTSEEVKANYESLEGKEVTVAGRIMSKRGQGKVVFSDIYDKDGKMQLFIKIDMVGEENLKQYKSLDLGDWVSATGEVFTTKTGEVSVKVSSFDLICNNRWYTEILRALSLIYASSINASTSKSIAGSMDTSRSTSLF